MKMVVTLSPEEVEGIVHDFLAQSFKNVGKVKLEYKMVSNGCEIYGGSPYPAFKGATCEVEN